MVVIFIERCNCMFEKFTIFNVVSMNEELEKEFHEFFYKYNLTALFTNEHRAGQIRVTDIDLRSVVKEGGKYHDDLKKFTDYLLLAQDNKMYEEAIFKIIYDARSFQGMMNMLRRLMTYIDTIEEDYEHNTWNIVWYTRNPY